MAGGGGGIIIIRSIKDTLGHPDVAQHITGSRRARMDALLARDAGSWSPAEVHFLIRCLSEAYDCV